MPIVGFNFTKISAERTEPKGTKINIQNNVHVENVEEMDIGDKKKALKFTFNFTSKYTPDLGNVSMTASVIYTDDDKKMKDVLKEWKKNKKVSEDVMPEIVTYVLEKCNIESIVLSREVSLPSPMPLPKIDLPGQKKE